LRCISLSLSLFLFLSLSLSLYSISKLARHSLNIGIR
jgi:hypothetical protein